MNVVPLEPRTLARPRQPNRQHHRSLGGRGRDPPHPQHPQREPPQPEEAQRPPATSRQSPVPAPAVLPPMVLLRMVPQRLRPGPPPHGNAIPRDLHVRDGGETCALSVPLPRMQPRRTLARPQAPVSTGAAPWPLEPGRQLLQVRRPVSPAHHHRISAARARAPWLLPYWSRLRASCDVLIDRSSIYAYSSL